MEIPKSIQKLWGGLHSENALENLSRLEAEYLSERGVEIKALISEGVKPSQIARMYGLSKQRLAQMIDPSMEKAHSAVKTAIKNGTLTRQPCRACGNPKTEAHHEDYSKPLDVVWLCRVHHRQADIERRRRLVSSEHS